MTAVFPDHQFAMESFDDVLQAVVFIVELQDSQGLRMNVDAELFGSLVHHDLCGAGFGPGQLIRVERGPGHGGDRGLHLGIHRGALGDGEVVVGAVENALDLRLEEEDGAGGGEPKDERDAKEAGVEVPAPDGAVVKASGCRAAGCWDGCGRHWGFSCCKKAAGIREGHPRRSSKSNLGRCGAAPDMPGFQP